MIKSVLIVIVVAFFAMLAENFFAHGKIYQAIDGKYKRRQAYPGSWHHNASGYKFVLFQSIGNIDSDGWKRIFIPAILIGLLRYLVVKFAILWLYFAVLLALLAIVAYYCYWYFKDGDRIRELLPFLPIFWILERQIRNLVTAIAKTLSDSTLMAIVAFILPKLVFGAFGVLLIICLMRKYRKSENIVYKIVAIIVAILLAIGAICVVADVFKGLKSDKAEVPDAAASSDVVEEWYHFYNTDLQYDEDDANNYNFGPDPQKADYKAQDYDQDFRNRLESDPALGAADLAWFDANMGTRFLGEFYDSCKGDWAKTINAAKVAWLNDQNLYKRTLVAFFAFLDTGKVDIADNGKGIIDQMYMNPYTIDTVPDVIVMKTDQQDGPFLVYTFNIKGNTKTVKYRISCGYQPTNVEKVMNITPQQKPGSSTPTKKSTPKPTSSKPTSSKPTPSKPSNPKDPSKSHNTGKNDDPGPGPDTNTGVGSTKSSKEKPSNSNNLSSYTEYKEEIKKLEEANQTAPSSNNPTTSTPAGAKVDNPSKEEVDAPAPSSPKVSAIEGDSNAQAWDGPAD